MSLTWANMTPQTRYGARSHSLPAWSEVPPQGVSVQLGSAPARPALRHGSDPQAPRVLAAYGCERCDIAGQDLELSPGRVSCWNCHGEATITARIVVPDGA